MGERRWAGPFGEKEFEEEVRAPFRSKTDSEVLEIMGGERIWWCETHQSRWNQIRPSVYFDWCENAQSQLITAETAEEESLIEECVKEERWLVKE